jgi:hypothetical protein
MLDHSQDSSRTEEELLYTYTFADIDTITDLLGIPWERSKDVPFCTTVPFIGLLWDLDKKTVSLIDKKKTKYRAAIREWNTTRTHNLKQVQKLYGKLLHTCLVVPRGRAYLMGLEAMLGIFHDSPLKPRTPPASTSAELSWWENLLSKPSLSRLIPGPCDLLDTGAFSDASSNVGIGIIIGQRWRAWRLIPGWKTDGRDIGWAEAVSFELLCYFVLQLAPRPGHFKVYGDNRGVVEGWWKGRSRNVQTNRVFQRIHERLEDTTSSLHTCYVTSRLNPADGPSRGIFPPFNLLLPTMVIPNELRNLIADFNAPVLPIEERLRRDNHLPEILTKRTDSRSDRRTAVSEFESERRSKELFELDTPWNS